MHIYIHIYANICHTEDSSSYGLDQFHCVYVVTIVSVYIRVSMYIWGEPPCYGNTSSTGCMWIPFPLSICINIYLRIGVYMNRCVKRQSKHRCRNANAKVRSPSGRSGVRFPVESKQSLQNWRFVLRSQAVGIIRTHQGIMGSVSGSSNWVGDQVTVLRVWSPSGPTL